MPDHLAHPRQVQQRLLAAQPGSSVSFGDIRVSVQGFGYEAQGALVGEWYFGEWMARSAAAQRAATAIVESLRAAPSHPL